MQPEQGRKVIMAMSGGVDSSVAAALLLQQGYQVIGATMETGYGHAANQAAETCRSLGIEHYVIDVQQEFRKQVVDEFVNSYLCGQTPNPCVICNKKIKFPCFWPLMQQLQADYFATGHYVRMAKQDGRTLLRSAEDSRKDQSYFLYQVPQDILKRCIFPLGAYSKAEVRQIAVAHNLTSAKQKDSFDVCFVADNDYRALLREHAESGFVAGDIVTESGELVGRHSGLANYTVGQRRGLNVALGYPAYVTKLDLQGNRLLVGKHEDLFCSSILITQANWLPFEQLEQEISAEVKIRYQAKGQLARITPQSASSARIDFAEPVWAVAAGQSAVCYKGDLLIGGGIIS